MKDAALERMLRESAGRRRHLRARRSRKPSGCTSMLRRTLPGRPLSRQDGRRPTARQTQDRFMADELKAIIATNAFGLGIDKQRHPLRGALPLSRARSRRTTRRPDARAATGCPAICTLLYRVEDRRVQSYFLGGKYPDVEEAAQRRARARAVSARRAGAPRRRSREQSGVRAAQGAHRARAAQAARPRARASRRQLGAARRAASRPST